MMIGSPEIPYDAVPTGVQLRPGPLAHGEICDRTMAGRSFQEYLGNCSRYLLPEEGSLKALEEMPGCWLHWDLPL